MNFYKKFALLQGFFRTGRIVVNLWSIVLTLIRDTACNGGKNLAPNDERLWLFGFVRGHGSGLGWHIGGNHQECFCIFLNCAVLGPDVSNCRCVADDDQLICDTIIFGFCLAAEFNQYFWRDDGNFFVQKVLKFAFYMEGFY